MINRRPLQTYLTKAWLSACYLLIVTLSLSSCGDRAQEASAPTSAYSVVDFEGNTLTLEKPAKRIIALAPHIVENTFSAGAGANLVGVSDYSNYPEQAKSISVVAGYQKINFEKIVELNPDLIIAWQSGNSGAGLSRLVELGFPVYIDQPDTIQDVAKSVRDIGILSGNPNIAESVAEHFLEQLETIQSNYAHVAKVSSFYQVWNSPLQTINGEHIISHAIEVCGGKNIYADEFAVAPIINIESILERNPTVIIASGMSDHRPEWLDDWLNWESLDAVEYNNLYFVNPDHIQRHSVRLLQGITAICSYLDEARSKQKQPS